jgi:putative nucleotidyltransferase with HDIG domain
MDRILELTDENTLRSVLQQHAESLAGVFAILDKDKNVIAASHENFDTRELVANPLVLKDSVIGYVAGSAGCSRAHLNLLAGTLSRVLETGYEIESLSAEVARTYEELALLSKVSSRLGSGLDINRICTVLADEVMNICRTHHVSVCLVQHSSFPEAGQAADSGLLHPGYTDHSFCLSKASLGTFAALASTMVLRSDRGLLGHIFERRQPITVGDVTIDTRYENLPFPVKSILLVPLLVENTPIGAVIASDKLNGEEFYSPEIKLIFNLASECAVSIRKAMLYDEIRTMLFSTAEAFASAIDAKDRYTYGHSKRVSEMCVNMVKEIGFSTDALNWIRLAALLHDIGKIGIPENILNKDGNLDFDEMGTIREHSEIGAKIIEHIPRFRNLSLWIRHHHERYDGSGYPDGLMRDAIPLPSRIIALADSFDALTTERPYNRAVTKYEALKTMKSSSGTLFDPYLYVCFEKTML